MVAMKDVCRQASFSHRAKTIMKLSYAAMQSEGHIKFDCMIQKSDCIIAKYMKISLF